MKSRTSKKMTTLVCVGLMFLMGLTPSALARTPQTFSANEVSVLSQRQTQAGVLAPLKCGTSDDSNATLWIVLGCVALALGAASLASSLKSAK